MTPLPPPEQRHLDAAEGWLGLGDHLAANDELDSITPRLRAHPDVLKLRFEVYAKAGKWEACADIARAVARLVPDQPFGHLALAHALRRAPGGGLEAALHALVTAADRIQDCGLAFSAACCCAQLGQLQEARAWLEKSFRLAEKAGTLDEARARALDERDLEPLWQEIGTLGP